MKKTVDIESLWSFINSLSLSRKNREWLSARLIEADNEVCKTNKKQAKKKKAAFGVMPIEQMSLEIQELVGSVPYSELDGLDGEFAREKYLGEKYGD